MRDGNPVGICAFAGLPAARIPAARRANPHLLIFPEASRENERIVMGIVFASEVPAVPIRVSLYSTTFYDSNKICLARWSVHALGHLCQELWTPKSTSDFCQQADDLARLCVASGFRLLIHRNPIAGYFKTSPPRGNQLDFSPGVLFSNLSRQTGGSRFVASKRTVFDRDFHRERANAG